jgi:hypothetical protein
MPGRPSFAIIHSAAGSRITAMVAMASHRMAEYTDRAPPAMPTRMTSVIVWWSRESAGMIQALPTPQLIVEAIRVTK